MKPRPLSLLVARFGAAALGVGLLAALGCGAPSAGPKTRAPASSQAAQAKVPDLASCAAAARHAASAAQQLHAESQLDAGYQLLEEHWQSCVEARRELYAARLAALHDLGYVDATRQLSAVVLADPLASKESRELARRLAPLSVGPQPTPASDLIRAAQLSAAALLAESAHETGNARVSWDKALHAYQRATGEPARPVALMAGVGPESLGEHGLLVPVRELPANRRRVAVLDLRRDGGHAFAVPTRLLDTGTKATPSISLGTDGAFLLTSEDRTAYFSNATAEPIYFPAAISARDGQGGVVVLAMDGALELRSAARPDEVEARQAVITTSSRVANMQSADSGRFVALCQGIDGAEPVIAVDTQARKFSVVIRDAVWCELDTLHAQLAVLRTEPTQTTAALAFELHPLDGRPPTRVALPKLPSIGDPRITLNEGTLTVAAGLGKARSRFYFQRGSGARAPRPQAERGPLRAIPVGSADPDTDVSALKSLSRHPRRLIKPYLATMQAWTANGVRSFDRRSVAVFDGDAEEGSIELILADTNPLRVRHRIPLEVGVNWLTAFFVSDRVLAVQSYPTQFFFDVKSGVSLGTGDMSDGVAPRELKPELFAVGSELWDLSAQAERRVDLGLGQDVTWKQTGQSYSAELGDAEGRIELNENGDVTLPSGEAPTWLYCAFGGTLANWKVCERRFIKN